MTLVFEQVSHGPLRQAQATFTRGRHALIGLDGMALEAFVNLSSGEVAPERGRVLLGGFPPFVTPAARRQVATLRAFEVLPPASSVSATLGLLLAARRLPLAAEELLRRFELETWAKRSPALLNMAELRTLMLLLALSDATARVLVLHEPLATTLPRARVLAALDESQAEVVVALTSSLDDARALNATWWMLDQGVLAQTSGVSSRTSLGPVRALRVRSPDARHIVAQAAEHEAISGVDFDAARAPDELTIHAEDVRKAALALTQIAKNSGAKIEAITLDCPPLEAVMAARQALVHAAYASAYQAAQANPPAEWGTIAYSGSASQYAPYQQAPAPAEAPAAAVPSTPNQSVALPPADPTKPDGA